MEKQEIISKVEESLEIEKGTLSLDTELSSLDEWDSVAILSTIVLFEEEFGKVIKGADLKSCKTVNDLLMLLQQ